MGSEGWNKLNPTCKNCDGGGFKGDSGIPELDVCMYCSGKGYIDLGGGEKEPIICSYCDSTVESVRLTPFFGDMALGAKMCEVCWIDSRENYIGATGEDCGPYKYKILE